MQAISPLSGITCDDKVVSTVEQTHNTAHSSGVGQLNEVSPASIASAPDEDLVTDDYVVVMYDGKIYPGVIEEVVNGEYHVYVLHPCKGN